MPHLDLGKYALFIWPAWGLSLVVLGGVTLQTLSRARHWKRELARREAEREAQGEAQGES
jgi:heme exporter protein D